MRAFLLALALMAFAAVALHDQSLLSAHHSESHVQTSSLADQMRAHPAHVQTTSSTASSSAVVSPDPALLKKYCITCHNQRLKTGGLALDTMDLHRLDVDTVIWERVVRKLRGREMPPPAAPRPEKAEYDEFIARLEAALDRTAESQPNAGMPVARRLNRTQYANAVRDLLALDVDVTSLLPPDESGFGFDNIGDVLSITPVLLDRYLLAAQKIARSAVGDPSQRPVSETFTVPMTIVQTERVSDDLPFASRGGILIRHTFPLDGEYVFKVRLRRSFTYSGIIGLENREQIDVRLDGVRVKVFMVGGECVDSKEQRCKSYPYNADDGLDVRIPVNAGPRVIGVSLVKHHAAPEGAGPERLPAASSAGVERGQMRIEGVTVEGPYAITGPGDTPSRRRIFVCRPQGPGDEDACARTILSTLARRAFRRPVTAEDIQPLLRLYRHARSTSGFDAGIEFALEAVLASPSFLLQIERNPPDTKGGSSYRVSDLELASRLSFFLWSSIPDDELLDLASRGRLRDPTVLDRQVGRMLRDPRAETLVTNFASQWLQLRELRKVAPDPWGFPDFDDSLRLAFEEETELFLLSQLSKDRGVLELLTADYTFVNERLARFYGIPNVYGAHFRRVPIASPNRAGLLGHGSILTVTSYATRTSPVLRGHYVLATLFGTPPPPPPADIPPFPETVGAATASVRARLEDHRKNPACAGCHARMDPLGFALENFNAIGKWRTHDAGSVIDATGTFPGGARFTDPTEFRTALLERREDFVRTVAEKLLTYALGRGAEYYDMPAIRRITKDASSSEYRWSSLILGIVHSKPFQMRTTQASAARVEAQRASVGERKGVTP